MGNGPMPSYIVPFFFGKVKRKAKVFHFPALFSRKFAVFDGFAKKYRQKNKKTIDKYTLFGL